MSLVRTSTVALALFAAAVPTLPSPAAQAGALAAQPGHNHKPGDGHKEHGEHEGEKSDLGTKKIAGYDVQVTQVGHAKAGAEAVFVIKIGGGAGKPKAVRAWVGVEGGQGSIKTKADEEKPGEWHAHHEVSKPVPAGAKLWVEVETGSGRKRDSFEYKPAA